MYLLVKADVPLEAVIPVTEETAASVEDRSGWQKDTDKVQLNSVAMELREVVSNTL